VTRAGLGSALGSLTVTIHDVLDPDEVAAAELAVAVAAAPDQPMP